MSKIYVTREWKGYGKQNYYRNEYDQDGDTVTKSKCNRFKSFDGKENNWEHSKREVARWKIDDPSMPDWLHKYIK